MNNKMLHMVSFVLVIVGGLNWLLVGVFEKDLVQVIFGAWPMVVKIIYILVGLGALYELVTHKKNCLMCKTE